MKKNLLLTALVAGGSLCANVTLPGIFSDHAVLQKSNATAIFGKADPGEEVTVSFAGKSSSAVAGKDGKWLVRLDLSQTDDAGHELVVKGKNTIKIKDYCFLTHLFHLTFLINLLYQYHLYKD